MFCELEGIVVDAPVVTRHIEFDFRVTSATDIELDDYGFGEPDCAKLLGRTLRVILERGKIPENRMPARGRPLVLERYDIDVIDPSSGASFRSVRYVPKAT